MTDFVRRLEILFWKTGIAIMQDRKAVRGIVLMICFLFILSSVSISLSLLNEITSARPKTSLESSQELISVPVMEPSQVNILIILTDRLDQKEPQLNGVWLAVFQLSERRLIFLPVYPGEKENMNARTEDLMNYFRLGAEGNPSEQFFEQIAQKRIWWDHYVMLDEVSLRQLVEATGGLNLGRGKLDGAEAISQFAFYQEDPQARQFTHAIVLRGLCQETTTLLSSPILKEAVSDLAGHWNTDIDFRKIQTNPPFNQDHQSLSCDIPLLREAYFNQGYFK